MTDSTIISTTIVLLHYRSPHILKNAQQFAHKTILKLETGF